MLILLFKRSLLPYCGDQQLFKFTGSKGGSERSSEGGRAVTAHPRWRDFPPRGKRGRAPCPVRAGLASGGGGVGWGEGGPPSGVRGAFSQDALHRGNLAGPCGKELGSGFSQATLRRPREKGMVGTGQEEGQWRPRSLARASQRTEARCSYGHLLLLGGDSARGRRWRQPWSLDAGGC